jgi:energy-coupling factor transporter ATP-binding protein EcfA2
MQLIAFSIEGYRRFVAKTSVKLHGGMVAFVGPNEAGKSSLLKAMSHLNESNRGFESNERPRRTTIEPRLAWHFQLEDEDKEAIKDIRNADQIERLIITKKADGSRTWGFEPRHPVRDVSKRSAAVDLLQKNRSLDLLSEANANNESPFNFAQYDAVTELLKSDGFRDLTTDEIRQISNLAASIRPLAHPSVDGEQMSEDQELEYYFTNNASAMLDEIASEESGPSPWRLVVDVVTERLPSVEFFNEEDRNLASEYDLGEVAASPPRALMHLANLADLDLRALLNEVNARAIADVATRRNAANTRLLAMFGQNWNQQGIAIQIDIQGQILYIQATTPEDAGLSDIGERSDGLRWFAALLAFSYGWKRPPIMLVDEIETHLHYDAQADLINVLSKQAFTSKVIYTTHSFGCLPNDLGTGVRVVEQIDAATSRLENGFWKRGAGFSPLLASMGAAAMSFTPTRRAFIAEGPSDAILLPTLLRQSNKVDNLGFHVAPGISGVAAMGVPGLNAEAGRVGFIVDGDEGGKALVAKLMNGGIEESRIIALEDSQSTDPLETEDLVDLNVYIAAVNDELRCWNELVVSCKQEDLDGSCRTKMLESWCRKHGYAAPDKTAVAQRIVDFSLEQNVFAANRQELLGNVLARARSILGLA